GKRLIADEDSRRAGDRSGELEAPSLSARQLASPDPEPLLESNARRHDAGGLRGQAGHAPERGEVLGHSQLPKYAWALRHVAQAAPGAPPHGVAGDVLSFEKDGPLVRRRLAD